MGLFTGIEDATSTAGGNYIKPGRHLLNVVVLRPKISRKKKSLAIAEFEVVESTVHDEGEEVSWVANLTDHDAAIGNVKGLLAGIAECEEDEVDEEGADRAFSDENPFADMQVVCNAFMIKTEKGNDFTKCIWRWANTWKGVKREAAAEKDEIPF